MADMLGRAWDQLVGRLTGPMAFRLVMQPIMAAILAARAGLADARSGQPAYLWAVFTNRADRWRLLARGWRDVAMVFAVACTLDAAYQVFVFQWFYPLQTAMVAALLAFVPYVLVRGPLARLMRRLQAARHGLSSSTDGQRVGDGALQHR